MDTNGALPMVGLLLCVGAIIVVALLAFAFRALTGAGRNQRDNMWNQRGPEQPRVDNPDIESSGGFGGVPNTGMDRSAGFDREIDLNRGSPTGAGGFGNGAQSYDQGRNRQDDDNIRSSGGFGSG